MSKIPSIDVLKEFIKDKEYVSVSMIQRELSIGYITSQKTIQYLIDKKYLEEKRQGSMCIGYCIGMDGEKSCQDRSIRRRQQKRSRTPQKN